MTSNDALPVVDLALWREGDAKQKASLAALVDEQLQHLGFFRVRNHGLDPAIRTAARQAVQAFFALPEKIKGKYVCPPQAYRGWVPPGAESNASSYSENQSDAPIVDLKEAYSVGPVFAGAERYFGAAPRWYAPNIWPAEELPQFQRALTAWSMAADRLTLEVLSVLDATLDLGPQWRALNCDHAMATVTANFYPDVDAEGGWRVGAHTDFGTITVLDRDEDNGLQIEMENGRWLDAPEVDDTLVINLGEMMVLLSRGRWRANPHRVVARPGARQNISLIYFHSPNFDCLVPAPDAGATVTAGEFLAAKMDQIIQR